MQLTDADQAALAGERGEAARLAMRVLTRMAAVMGATAMLEVTGAHIDSCLYHGPVGLEFAARLAEGGGRVVVPTTLNVSSLDLLHPDLYRGDAETARLARRQMQHYEAMGCRPTWTCAPYQMSARPAFGEHVAWAESNAIVFANSVLGARTNRYGDFIDICAALVGRVPAAGFHLDEHRRGQVLFRLVGVGDALLDSDVLYPVLGSLIGAEVDTKVPVIDGLPEGVNEDRLKAIGAAAASTGSVGMFHTVGSTPEAGSLEEAFGGGSPERVVEVGPAELRAARDRLSTVAGDGLGAVSVGTPHYSVTEFERLVELLDGRRVRTPLYASTGREVAAALEASDVLKRLVESGVTVVTDTCTYITPILGELEGPVLTDSAKWAYYAPGNIGVEVLFGSVEDCVESAVAGAAVRDEGLWR